MTGKIKHRAKRAKNITDYKTRRRVKRFQEKVSSKYKLDLLFGRTRKNFSIKNLLIIAKEIDYPKLQKAALKEFLTRINLNFDNFYQALILPREILALDAKIENELWKQCLALSTPDNLVELIELGEKRAAKELFHRIKTKSISERKAKQILIWLLEKATDKKLIKRLFKEIEKIGPDEQELKYLRDLKKINSMLRLSQHIEHLLAKWAQRKTEKTIIELKELVKEIKISELTKQGQE